MDFTVRSILIAVTTAISITSASGRPSLADAPQVAFDLPPITAASSTDDDPALVTFQLRLSSIIPAADAPRVDQWLVRCQPRNQDVLVADYAPRTETSSDLATPIQVKEIDESSQAFGISIDANHGNLVTGHAGTDHSKKTSTSQQFDRLAPHQAVTAAGTINRGRGVYFKLRWTARQVLEGEKRFSITLRVPEHWRGSLVDVSVVAQAQHKSLVSWETETKTVGSANFVIAVYRQGDSDALATAQQLADAEQALRAIARRQVRTPPSPTLPNMLRHVARKLDLQQDRPQPNWLPRVLLDQADPHLDKEICKLSMPTRLAVLNYDELRLKFASLSTR